VIAWLLWFFLSLPLFLLDGWLVQEVWPVPSLTFALCMFLGLYARPSALPGLLLCAALARSVLVGGDAALHVLILGMPVSALVPLRLVFYRRHLLWQCTAASFLAVTVPKATAFLGRFAEAVPDAPPVSWSQILWAACAVPPATWVLRSIPPLSLFRESAE
jgi:hypothetical protein